MIPWSRVLLEKLDVTHLVKIYLVLETKGHYRVYKGPPISMPYIIFRNKLVFYSEELLAPRPTPKLEDHRLSAVRDFLFNVFVATLHTWRPSPPSATRGCAMPR